VPNSEENPGVSIFYEDPVLIAPQPLFTRLRRDHKGMMGLMIVPGHMCIGRVVTAQGCAAGLTDPEV